MDQLCLKQTQPVTKEGEKLEIELYFLIAKFLSLGPCKKAFEVLKEEIEKFQILPSRLDWLGQKHRQSFEEYERNNVHISKNFLLKLMQRFGPAVEQLYPSFPTVKHTLLGIGSQSLLRNTNDLQKTYPTAWSTVKRHYGNPILEPSNLRHPPNLSHLLFGREVSGSVNRGHFLSNKFYTRLQLFARNVGHLSAVYCTLFDRRGRYIITGADDTLVKIWSIIDGRLVATLRGASAEISDLAIDYENTMVAAGSCDKIIRVWSLQTLAPIAVLTSHHGMITALLFCPSPSKEGVLVSTGGDGCVSFWTYRRRGNDIKFDQKPLKMNEKVRPGHSQLICASFSQGGSFLTIGGADHHVRVYFLSGPNGIEKILEIETHQDRVDSIQWCHTGIGFASGSRNGTALIWRFERQQWKPIKLDMTLLLPGFTLPVEDTRKVQVTMVGWDRKDLHVVTASSDRLLRVWNSRTGELRHILKGHEDNVYVIEAHPIDDRLILSAGHDGQLFIWDIFDGTIVKSFKNTIEGQGYGSLFDAKWTPDGFNIAATDSHGHILIFGIGHNDLFKKIPQELFFHTDYRPLVRDVNHYVLDEQTQLAPHLMPPPFLVNVDGDPYPPTFQRLVPRREKCREDQLIPNVVTNDDGQQEVLDVSGVEAHHAEIAENASAENRGGIAALHSLQRPNLDDMIERLAQEQNQRIAQQSHNADEGTPGPSGIISNDNSERRNSATGPYPDHSYAIYNQDPLSPRAGRVGARRVGDVEGIRHSTGNWQRDPTMKWNRHIFLKPLSPAALHQSEEKRHFHSDLEIHQYQTECRKKPECVRPLISEISQKSPVTKSKKQKKKTHAYSTRASRGTPEGRRVPSPEPEEPESFATFDSSHSENLSDIERDFNNSSSSDEQSTDYSDWTAEAGANLEPPKRTAHKQKKSPVDVKNRKRRRRASGGDKSDQFSDSQRKHRRRRRRGVQPVDDEGDNDSGSLDQPSTSRIRRGVKRVNMSELSDNVSEEMPTEFCPPEWLSETIPKKAPYFPQMGDEIIYFRQGHQLYVEAVINRKLYSIDKWTLPWSRKPILRDQEHVKIIGIKYEIKPPRLCCLKLGIINDLDGSLGSDSFTIKYHDMEDVLDFLVLRQTYDNAVKKEWNPGDRFRCIIDDAWWCGEIEIKDPHLSQFPDSMFMCYRVVWDNGERERLSPWDLEPIDQNTKVPELGGCLKVHPSEHKNLLYTINSDEWAGRPYEEECQRIADGIGKIMQLAAAEAFLTTVNLSAYPQYAMIVEYPIDLSTIKSRLENLFYRRPTAIQFDVRYIATNAEKFNEKGSNIVKQARIITDLCLRLIKDRHCNDPISHFHEIQSNYQSPNNSEDEVAHRIRRRRNRLISEDDEPQPTPRRLRGLDRGAPTSSAKSKVDHRPWQTRCKDLLRSIFERQDSAPFRYPVNSDQYHDYNQVIDVPMDLTTVREELSSRAYTTPNDFAKDMRTVFINSKTYNTNKRSRIYSMTLRLEAYFEDQFKGILAAFKSQEESSEVGQPSTSNDNITINLRMNGLLSSNDDSSDDDRSTSVKGSINERGMRRSHRVAQLRRMNAESDDSGEEYSPSQKPSKRSPLKCSPMKIPKDIKAILLKQGKRYEDDSDYEAPPPPRRNSSSSSTKTKRSKRYEDDSDFEGPPVSPAKEELSGGDSSNESSKEEGETKDESSQIAKIEEEVPLKKESLEANVASDNKVSNLEDSRAVSKTNGVNLGSVKRRIESSSSESEEYKPKFNGYHPKSSSSSKGSDTNSHSSNSSKSKPSSSSQSKKVFKHKKLKKEPTPSLDSDSDSDSESELETKNKKAKKARINISSPEIDIEGSTKEDSEFELDEEELEAEETEESEVDDANKRRSRRVCPATGIRKTKKAVLDGDDLDDQDFELKDFIDDEVSSSDSSESEGSEGSSEPTKKKHAKLPPKSLKKKRSVRKIKKQKTKKSSNSRMIKNVSSKKRSKKSTKSIEGQKNQRASGIKSNAYQSITVSPETHTIKHVRHKGKVIGRVITQKDNAGEDIASEDYSETPPLDSDEETPLGVHSMVIGNFSQPSSTKRSLDDDDDSGSSKNSFEKDEDYSEVGRRGRVRKRVRYAEEDSDFEMSSISSRGRLRKVNSRMKDFV